MGDNALIPLVGLSIFDFAHKLVGQQNLSIITVEYHYHLFQAVSPGLWIGEPDYDPGDYEHGDENEIVFPCNAGQRDRINEYIEKESNVGGA